MNHLKIGCFMLSLVFISSIILPILSLGVQVAIPSSGTIVPPSERAQVVVFRPFTSGYEKGSISYDCGTNTSAYDRQWNFAGWTVNQLNMTVQFSGLVGYTRPVGTMRVYVSINNGTAYPYSFDLTIPTYTITLSDPPWGALYGKQFTFDITAYANLFGPKTKIKWTVFGYAPNQFTVSVAYWGLTQTPVPPYDFKGENYDQYYTMFTVDYTESTISYVLADKVINATSDKYHLDLLAQSIENHMHYYSGAIMETNVSAAAQNTWGTGATIYPSIDDRAIRSLIKYVQYDPVNRNHYLVMALRYLNWSFSILTEVAGVPGKCKAYKLDGGGYFVNKSQLIDSNAAHPIELVALYYNATHDTVLLDSTWEDLKDCYTFLKSLNVTSGPAAGLCVNAWGQPEYWLYPSDGTDPWEKTYLIYAQDNCEVYWGVKAFAYLAGLKGETALQTEANTWASSMKIKIDDFFWDETAGKYRDTYWINTQHFEQGLSYAMIAPCFYHIIDNETRIYSTVEEYTSWGTMGGRYYNYTNPLNIEKNTREHATMTGMVQVVLGMLKVDYVDVSLYPEYANYTQFLYDNPVYGGSLLDNRGYLSWVDIIEGTYAADWERLIESTSWGIEGLLAYPCPLSTDNVTILDSPAEDWVFVDEQYYTLRATYTHEDGGQYFISGSPYNKGVAKIGFFNNEEWIGISYNLTSGITTVENGSDYVSIHSSNYTISGNDLSVDFHVFFTGGLFDAYNTTFWMYVSDDFGVTTGWIETNSTFNIYNLGGHG